MLIFAVGKNNFKIFRSGEPRWILFEIVRGSVKRFCTGGGDKRVERWTPPDQGGGGWCFNGHLWLSILNASTNHKMHYELMSQLDALFYTLYGFRPLYPICIWSSWFPIPLFCLCHNPLNWLLLKMSDPKILTKLHRFTNWILKLWLLWSLL